MGPGKPEYVGKSYMRPAENQALRTRWLTHRRRGGPIYSSPFAGSDAHACAPPIAPHPRHRAVRSGADRRSAPGESHSDAMHGTPGHFAVLHRRGISDHQIERFRNAELAFDFQTCAGRRQITNRATDRPGAIECNRTGFEHPVSGTIPSLSHGSPANIVSQILPA